MEDEFIEDRIILKLIENISGLDYTLTHGRSGVLVALSHYNIYSSNNNNQIKVDLAIQKCIDELIEDIETKYIDCSFAFGLAGISYSLRTAYELGQEEKINLDWIEELNDVIFNSLINFIQIKEYDFLRGASGIIKYFLTYYPKEKYFVDFVESLFNEAIWIENDRCYWTFYSFNEEKKELEYKEDVINIGLAHGICTLIVILSEIYEKGFSKEKCYKLIEGSIKYLMSIQNFENVAQFPGIIYNKTVQQNSSRLGWCYGDSSVALSIIKAGINCNNLEWFDYGNSIGLISTKRDFENAGLEEHGICHGYFGTMHIYNVLFKATNDINYRERAKYWKEIGMKNRDFEIDDLGFFQTELNNNGTIRKFFTYELLQGLPGVYLCLASHEKKECSWDAMFLTNLK